MSQPWTNSSSTAAKPAPPPGRSTDSMGAVLPSLSISKHEDVAGGKNSSVTVTETDKGGVAHVVHPDHRLRDWQLRRNDRGGRGVPQGHRRQARHRAGPDGQGP